MKELQLEVESLQVAAKTSKETRIKRESVVFDAGVASRVKDCVKLAYKIFPNNDFSKLGPDVVAVLEEAKAEEDTTLAIVVAVESVKPNSSRGEVLPEAQDAGVSRKTPEEAQIADTLEKAQEGALATDTVSSDLPTMDDAQRLPPLGEINNLSGSISDFPLNSSK